MGQKTNPIGLRLGITRSWDSVWFAKGRSFARLVERMPGSGSTSF
jgi:small subunit ribosomal protein S3